MYTLITMQSIMLASDVWEFRQHSVFLTLRQGGGKKVEEEGRRDNEINRVFQPMLVK